MSTKKKLLRVLLITVFAVLTLTVFCMAAEAAAPVFKTQPSIVYWTENDVNTSAQTVRIYVGVNTDGTNYTYYWNLRTCYGGSSVFLDLKSVVSSDTNYTGNSSRLVADIPLKYANDSSTVIYCTARNSSGQTNTSNYMSLKKTTVTINKQPANVVCGKDDYDASKDQFTVRNSISATGPNIGYQWQYSTSNITTWTNLPGQTGASFLNYWKPSMMYLNGATNRLRCVITLNNTTYRATNTATVNAKPVFTTPLPYSLRVAVIEGAEWYNYNPRPTAKAIGNGTLTYKWQYRATSSSEWKDLSTANGETGPRNLNPKYVNTAQIRCVVTDSKGYTAETMSYHVIGVKQPVIKTDLDNTFFYSNESYVPSKGYFNYYFSIDAAPGATGDKLTYGWYASKNGGSWTLLKTTTDYFYNPQFTLKELSYPNVVKLKCVVTAEGTNSVTSKICTVGFKPIFVNSNPTQWKYGTNQIKNSVLTLTIQDKFYEVYSSSKITTRGVIYVSNDSLTLTASYCDMPLNSAKAVKDALYGTWNVDLNYSNVSAKKYRLYVKDEYSNYAVSPNEFKLVKAGTIPQISIQELTEVMSSSNSSQYQVSIYNKYSNNQLTDYQWFYEVNGGPGTYTATDASAATDYWKHTFTEKELKAGVTYYCTAIYDDTILVKSNEGFAGLLFSLSKDPKSEGAYIGDTVKLSTTPNAYYGNAVYRWEYADKTSGPWTALYNGNGNNGCVISGADSTGLELKSISEFYIGKYYRLNVSGTILNPGTVCTANIYANHPLIIKNAQNLVAGLNTTATFSVEAKGSSALTYHWLIYDNNSNSWAEIVSDENIKFAGVNTPDLKVTGLTKKCYDALFHCLITDKYNHKAISAPVGLIKPDIHATSLLISPSSVTFNSETESLMLSAVLSPSDAIDKVIWSSDNPKIAEINPSTGFLKAVKAGKTRIYCKTENGKHIDYIEVTVLHKHYFNQKTVDAKYLKQAATCTEPAIYNYSCACGDPGAATFSSGNPLGHSLTKIPAKAATCKAAGNILYYKCSRCGKLFTDDNGTKSTTADKVTTAKLTTHKWDAGKVTKKATCAATGVKTYTCTVCKTTKTDTIAKLTTHTWDNGKVTKKATCAATGVKTYTCTVCQTTKTDTIAKLTTHTWDNGKVTKKATATETGIKTFTCTVCKTTKTEVIPKTRGITFKLGDIDNDGNITSSDARIALRAAVGLGGDKDVKGNLLNFGKTTNREYLAADIDGSTNITADDARIILRISVGLEDVKKYEK